MFYGHNAVDFNITRMARVVTTAITSFKSELLCSKSALAKSVFIIVE